MKVASLFLTLLVWGCDDAAAPGPGNELPRDRCKVAAIVSDLRSATAVSLLAADGAPCSSDQLHSGSRPPGLLTALSSDVVMSTTGRVEAGGVVLIDRTNAVVTVLDATAADTVIRRQYSVGQTLSHNPQDVLALGDGTAIVAQLERDGAGQDLVHIDLEDGAALATIDLSAAADVGFDPQPTQLAALDGAVWVGLVHATRGDFSAAGPGRVVAVDVATKDVTVVTLDAFTNCSHLAADGSGVWVACSGLFPEGLAAQLAHSGLAYIEDGGVRWTFAAVDAPFGFTLAPLDAHRLVVLEVAQSEDRLVVIDRRDDSRRRLLTTRGFTLGSALVSPEAGMLLVAVGDDTFPRLERFSLSTLQPLAPLTNTSRTGLPPRQLTFY